MKQNVKRIWLVLCMAVCLFALSGCTQAGSKADEIDPMIKTALEQGIPMDLQTIAALDDNTLNAAIAQAQKSKDTVGLGMLQSWESIRGDLGALLNVGAVTVEVVDEGYAGRVNAAFEQRNMEFTVIINDDMQALSYTFTPEYTMGETMTKAALNTLLGMGTVFAVLIFISWLISCFKYINKWETAQKNKAAAKKAAEAPAAAPAPAAPKAAPAPVAVPAVEDVSDDTELIAVIAAAIAASEGKTSADGLVVRSIKRVPNRNWK